MDLKNTYLYLLARKVPLIQVVIAFTLIAVSSVSDPTLHGA